MLQPAQVGYSYLCQQNPWYKSKQACVGCSGLGGRIGYGRDLLQLILPLPGPDPPTFHPPRNAPLPASIPPPSATALLGTALTNEHSQLIGSWLGAGIQISGVERAFLPILLMHFTVLLLWLALAKNRIEL